MKNIKYIKISFLFLLSFSSQLMAQNGGESLVGKWQTEDKTILEVFKTGVVFSIKQRSAIKAKDKVHNGKMIGKTITFFENSEYKGIVIDPSNNKEYKAVFTITANGKSLKMQVKWGLINFTETWVRL